MLFYEPLFLFLFLPLTLVVAYLLPRPARNGWLFLASAAFYASAGLRFLPLLLFSIVMDFLVGRALGRATSQVRRKQWLWFSVVVNLSLLFFFKYAGLVTGSIKAWTGWDFVPVVDVPLPIGISFYTFQSMSYVIDIYRREAEPARSLLDFGAYVALFPQLIAGPIVRYGEMERELRERSLRLDGLVSGVRFFVLGLAKKLLIADTAAALADPLFALESPGFAAAWASVLLYSFQIYFDFSGYSDMAVGLGRMLGFQFPQNFNSPYKASSFADFWRRWHMTLSRWLRDNLYVPLGGSRHGSARTHACLFATMLLGGIWHGAGWNYLVWGAYHGALLAVERAMGMHFPLNFLPRWIRTLLVFVAVSVGWVFFRCADFSQSGVWLRALFLVDGWGSGAPLLAWAVCLAVGLCVWMLRNIWERAPGPGWMESATLATSFLLCIVVACGKGSSPFLYFRF